MPGLSSSAVFGSHELVGSLHLLVNRTDGRVLLEEFFQGGFLSGEQVFGVCPECGQVAAVIFDLGCELAEQIDEVFLDDPNDVEAISYDAGIGEVPLDQSPVGAAEIHADNTHVFFAFELGEVGLKVLRVTTFDNIEYPVVAQVTQGGGKVSASTMASSFAVDGVFVDTENWWADSIEAFVGFFAGVLVIAALDGGGAYAAASGQRTACDTVSVQLVDALAEGFGGVTVFFDAGQFREEGFTASSAQVATGVYMQVNASVEGIEVPDFAEVGTFAVNLRAAGLATLVLASLRFTAGTGRLVLIAEPGEMKQRLAGLLFNSLYPITS